MERPWRRDHLRVIVFGCAVAVLAGFSAESLLPRAEAQSAGSSSRDGATLLETPTSEEVLWAYQNAFRNAAQVALPVVVKIDVVNVVTQRVPALENPFNFFFGTRQEELEERELRRPGLGSGVIVSRVGERVYILTNAHVIGTAQEITVSLHDGRAFEATRVGTDERRDLALIVFETSENVPIATLGDSDEVTVGDWVFAVGNPLGYESTVTSGIISAVGRRPAAASRIAGLTDYFQTDAAINRGNSGGALVNLAGEVIGINTWIAGQTGGNVGLGFAIPINNAKRAIDELINVGAVEYGWLGIGYGGAITTDVAGSIGYGGGLEGALVGSVYEESPAAQAGLRPGDIVTQVNGARVRQWADLVNFVADQRPGSTVTFRFWRDGRTLSRRVEIGRRLNDEELADIEFWPGIVVMPLPAEMRESLGMRNEPGTVVIADVIMGGPAANAGLRRGDIIRRVNNEEVRDLAEFYRILNAQAEDELAFRLAREGREYVIGLVR